MINKPLIYNTGIINCVRSNIFQMKRGELMDLRNNFSPDVHKKDKTIGGPFLEMTIIESRHKKKNIAKRINAIPTSFTENI